VKEKKTKKPQLDSLTLPDRENKQWTTSAGRAYEFQHISRVNVKVYIAEELFDMVPQ
jgi:hypothetical protein